MSCHLDYQIFTCNDDASDDLSSALSISCEQGQTVTIVVDAFGPNAGVHRLNIRDADGFNICPVDDLGGALDSPVASGTIPEGYFGEGDNFGNCTGGPPIRGFEWTAPTSGRFQIDTFGSNYDTVLTLRDECYGEVYVCDDDSGPGLQSAINVELSEGSRVVIEVSAFAGDSFADGSGYAEFALNINQLD